MDTCSEHGEVVYTCRDCKEARDYEAKVMLARAAFNKAQATYDSACRAKRDCEDRLDSAREVVHRSGQQLDHMRNLLSDLLGIDDDAGEP